MNYSYLMGIEDVAELEAQGFSIVSIDGDYGITFSKDKIDIYEEFVQKELTPGYWNEYLGDVWVFIFKFENGDIKKVQYDTTTEKEILALCCQFADCTFPSVLDMLQENEFYVTNYFKLES